MSNTDVMRDAYARYGNRDFDLVNDSFAEDIDWKIEGVVEVSGRQAVRKFFNGLAEQFSGHTITIDDSVEDGDRLICFVTHRVTRHDGESGEFKAVHDWRFRDGRGSVPARDRRHAQFRDLLRPGAGPRGRLTSCRRESRRRPPLACPHGRRTAVALAAARGDRGPARLGP
jgi:ketosteroid isomerase-like protein